MLTEFRKSMQLVLHERITGPLSGALAFSWVAWNWRTLYYLFAFDPSITLQDRLTHVSKDYLNWSTSLVGPAATAILLVAIYPLATTGALWASLQYRKWQNSIRQEIEGKQLLTLEESLIIRRELRVVEENAAELIRARDREFESLKGEIAALKQAPRPRVIKHIPTVIQSLSQMEKIILKKASGSNGGRLKVSEDSTGIRVVTSGGVDHFRMTFARNRFSKALTSLVDAGLIKKLPGGNYRLRISPRMVDRLLGDDLDRKSVE